MRFVPLVAAALVVTTLVVTLDAPRPIIDLDQAAAELETLSELPGGLDGTEAAIVGGPPGEDGVVPAAPPPPPVAVLGTPPRPRVAIFGDSTALMTAMGLFVRGQTSGEVDFVRGDPQLGCGIGRGGEYRSGNEYGVVPEKCQWEARWADRVAVGQPNVAVVQIGPWDVGDRRLPGDDTWRAVGDPVYDDFLLAEMTAAVDTLSAGGAQVLWLSAPPVGAGMLGDAQQIRGVAAIPERTARLNELIGQLPMLRPGKVRVVDLAGWLASTGEDVRLRPDGVHFSKETSIEVAERWLERALIDEFHAAWTATERERLAQVSAARTTVLVLGDPSAAGIAESLATWGASSGLVDVVTIGQPPCGVLPTSRRRGPVGIEPTPAECDQLQYGWMQSAVAARADVVLVAPSIWDVTDVSFDDGHLVSIGDPGFDERAAAEIGELDQALRRAAPSVVWLAPPALTWHGTDGARGAAIDPTRSTRYAQLLSEATTGPGSTVIDLGELVARAPALAADPTSPVDGFVLDPAGNAVLGLWLGPAVLDAT